MTNSLDEISRALGRIEGNIEETNRQTSALFTKFDKINDEVVEHRGAMKLLAQTQIEQKSRHDTLEAYVDKDIAPATEDFKAVKNRSIGALMGFGIASGSLGAALATWANRLLGGPHG